MVESINNFILFGLIVLAVYFDLSTKKIPNAITFPVILWGLIVYTVFGGFVGFKFTLIGFLVGLAIFLLPFILGGMGAGDVKLMAAIGALMGWKFALKTAVASGLVGGVIVIIYSLYKKTLWTTIKSAVGLILRPLVFILATSFNSERLEKAHKYFSEQSVQYEKHYIPYGVAIGLGAIIVFIV